MASTLIVLVWTLILPALIWIALLAACSGIARRSGQSLKSLGVGIRSGFAAEFYPPKDDGEDTLT
jgi:hypothetical protein